MASGSTMSPGTVNTPRSGRPVDDPDDPLAKGITLGRRGTPTDIANARLSALGSRWLRHRPDARRRWRPEPRRARRARPAGVRHQPGDPGPLRVLSRRLRRPDTGRGRPRRPRPDRACGPHGVRPCAARPDRRSTSRHEAGTRSVLDHLVERARLSKKGEHVVVAPGDDGMEGVEQLEERLAPSITPL